MSDTTAEVPPIEPGRIAQRQAAVEHLGGAGCPPALVARLTAEPFNLGRVTRLLDAARPFGPQAWPLVAAVADILEHKTAEA